jgi:hypothetical protein
LEDNACPLAILIDHPTTGGSIIFQIRRCTPDILAARKLKKKNLEQQQQQQQQIQLQLQQQQQHQKMMSIQSQPNLQSKSHHQIPIAQNRQQKIGNQEMNEISNLNNNNKLPCLIELNQDGFELQAPRIVQIKSDFYEIGNDQVRAATHPTNYIRLDPAIPGIDKKHCALKKSSDNLQLLLIPFGETYVNDRLVKEATQLFNNYTIRIGKYSLFRLENPNETTPMIIANQKPPMNQNNFNQQQQIPPNYGVLYESRDNSNFNHQLNEPTTRSFTKDQPSMAKTTIIPPPTQPLADQNVNKSSTENGGLPGLLEFPDNEGEDSLLSQICTTNQSMWQFKLAPVYTMYMMLRYRLSQKYHPEATINEKLSSCSLLIHKMVNYIREAVHTNHLDRHVLPFWLANSSELLYFLKQDVHLSQVSYDAQELLADSVQMTFKYLVNIMEAELDDVLVAFYDPSDQVEDVIILPNGKQQPADSIEDNAPDNAKRPTLKKVIQVLNETMNLLRGSRVNAALTIQLFSQLFHYISMWLFNRLVNDTQRAGFCSQYWGIKITRRISRIQQWAEKQGLELAADCHLSRIIQASFFLQAPKHDIKHLTLISSSCFALNSAQLKCLLKNYVLAANEAPLSAHLCSNLCAIAQSTADDLIKQEGRQVNVEEDVDLQLPFLLPEDGHSCDIIKGLPAGLLDFLENLQNNGHCWLWQNTQGPGSWKKFMKQDSNVSTTNLQANEVIKPATTPTPPITTTTTAATTTTSDEIISKQNIEPLMMNNEEISFDDNKNPNIIQLTLTKKNKGLGLSIVAARATNAINSGIYIKAVVAGGAADSDGRLEAGDQLLAVDDSSLVNVTQERAAQLMTQSGVNVHLTVSKKAAYFHGLDALLNKSPPPPPQQQQQQQQPQPVITSSMPILNEPNFQQFNNNGLMNNQQQPFTATTLPRNLQSQFIQQQQPNQNQMIYNGGQYFQQNSHQQQQQQIPYQQQQQKDLTSVAIINTTENGTTASFRTRSMSQEILKQDQELPSQKIQFQNLTPNKASNHHHESINNNYNSIPHQFNTNIKQPLPPQRTLSTEQVRFGSERPISMISNQNGLPFSSNVNNYANQITSNNNFQQQHQQQQPKYPPSTARTLTNDSVPRFGSERPAATSYNPQNFDLRAYNNQPNKPQYNRKPSLSEVDEINYNNQQENSNNKFKGFDDLYGNNNLKSVQINNNNNNKQNGQLYEQMWAANNGNNEEHLHHHNKLINQQQHSQPRQSFDETNSNIEPLKITKKFDYIDANIRMKQMPNVSAVTSLTRLNGQSNDLKFNNGRNYENHDTTNGSILQQQQQQTMPPRSMSTSNTGYPSTKPIVPPKTFNINRNNNHSLNTTPTANLNIDDTTNLTPVSISIMNAKWKEEQRKRQEDEMRIEMLQRRCELVEELESKDFRTEEEEVRLVRLKTEIEFDRRVIEMNSNDSSMKTKNRNRFNQHTHNNSEDDDDDDDDENDDNEAEDNDNSNDQDHYESQNRKNIDEKDNEEDNFNVTDDGGGEYDLEEATKNEMKHRMMKQQQHLIAESRRRQYEMQMQLLNNSSLQNNSKEEDTLERRLVQLEIDRERKLKFDLEEMQREEQARQRRHQMKLQQQQQQQQQTNNSYEQQQHQSNQRSQKHVQFSSPTTDSNNIIIDNNNQNNISPKFSSHSTHSSSSSSSLSINTLNTNNMSSSSKLINNGYHVPTKLVPSTPSPAPLNGNQTYSAERDSRLNARHVMFNDMNKFIGDFEETSRPPLNSHQMNGYQHQPATPSVIGANEVYVDQRLRAKQREQEEQKNASMFIEGEKLSFREKMKMFAAQSGGEVVSDINNPKGSRKQREIESKFEIK